MIARVEITDKSDDNKLLYSDQRLTIQAGVGLWSEGVAVQTNPRWCALLARMHGKEPKSTLFNSTIAAEHEIEVGVYEQKIDLKLLGDYLSDPATTSGMLVGQLSGGQPVVLVVDVPTIHLLVSIPL